MAGDNRGVRLGFLGVVALVLLGILGTRLWFLQVVDAEALTQRVEKVRQRRAFLPPERGRIFDAQGRVLADNERVLTVVVDREVIRKKASRTALFERLQGPLGSSVAELEARYESDPFSPVLPFPLIEDIDEATALFLKERVEDYPGIDIREDWRRRYLYAPLASHIVGYMGAIPEDDPNTQDDETSAYTGQGYQLNEKIGSAGVERYFERDLRGTPGFAIYEVDTIGRVIKTLEQVDPVPGKDVQLTIDLDYQQFAEQSLETVLKRQRFVSPYAKDEEDPRRFTTFYKAPAGSVVVERHATGEIVAMATYPTFDNRWFGSGISGEKFAQLFPPEDKDIAFDDRPPSPLINRAIQGRYNVGSSFKPFTAYSAIHSGFIPNPFDFTYDDQGIYEILPPYCDKADGQKCEFRNAWNYALGAPTHYGELTVSDALAVSSDTFFYRVGAEVFTSNDGAPVLQDELKLFGFGEKSGIELPFEYKGIVPDAEVKARLAEQGAISDDEGGGFFVGDSVLMAIGQGLVAVTPLQLTNAYATLANGGFLLKPLLVKAIFQPGVPDSDTPGVADIAAGVPITVFGTQIRRQLDMNPVIRDPIVEGLSRVIVGPGTPGHQPTGVEVFRGFPYSDIPIAGKTGTAQGRENLPENDSSVFAAFQLDLGGYSVASYLEKAGYGKQAAAPLVRCMLLAVNGKYQLDPVELADPLDLDATRPAPPKQMPDESCLDVAVSTTSRER
jgi:penicillin-binding protein 2